MLSCFRLDEASQILAKCVNNDEFISKANKSKHQLWNELCDMISKNPTKIQSLNVDAIIRSGLRRYTDQVIMKLEKLIPLWLMFF